MFTLWTQLYKNQTQEILQNKGVLFPYNPYLDGRKIQIAHKSFMKTDCFCNYTMKVYYPC